MTDTHAQSAESDRQATGWQRLSPLSIVYFVLSFILSVVRGGFQNIAIFGGIIFASGDRRLDFIILGGIAGLVLLLAASVLSYLNFRFRVNRNSFLIHKGVLKKNRLTLSFDRIQNIAIKEPVYFRPFELVTLSLESAGSASEEVSLAGIDRRMAEELRKTVLAGPETPSDTAAGAQNVDTQEDCATDELLHHRWGELVRYGLSNNNTWVFAGLLAGAISQIDGEVGDRIAAWINLPDNYFASLDTVGATVLGVTVLLGLFGAMMLVSVIGAVVIYYDYRLAHSDGRFLRVKGIFERSETSLPIRKVQALEIKQPWPARLLARSHATLLQVGFENNWEDGNIDRKQAKFIVPSLTDEKAIALASRLYPPLNVEGIKFEGVDPLYLKRLFFIDCFLPSVALSTALSLLVVPWFLLLCLLPLPIFPLLRLHHRKQGFWTDGRFVAVRTGVIGHKLVIFPVEKAQSVKVSRTPGQRRHGLASLTIKLAGHKVKIPYVRDRVAAHLRDHILRKISMIKTSWM